VRVVHLVGSLPPERGVRDSTVVLCDVELDQAADLGLGVEVVEEEPAMFEHAPPGLDQGVREGDLRLGEHAP